MARHWDEIYRTRSGAELSWTQAEPVMSLRLIDQLPLDDEDAIVDVGGGESTFVDALLDRGHQNVTVLDASAHALARARARLIAAGQAAGAASVTWVTADVRAWRPARAYRLWHDRAMYHFLTDPADRAAYCDRAAAAVASGGFLVIATFSADGPTRCSGLPVLRYGPTELAAEFAPAFTMISSADEHHHTPWGAVQHFTWLVLLRSGPNLGDGARADPATTIPRPGCQRSPPGEGCGTTGGGAGPPPDREGPIVYARSTTVLAHLESIDAGVAHIRDEVMPMLFGMDGCIGLSMLVDRITGRCIATAASAGS